MDMGLKGKNAIICASSRGLGKGCAKALASEGVDLVINGRDQEVLSSTANEIRNEFNVKVIEFCADITSKVSQSKLLELCPSPDILVNNAGGPPPGDFRDWNREDWMSACIANMFTPIELIKAYVDGQAGHSETLQEVTDNGNTTTNSIMIGSSSSPADLLHIADTVSDNA